jgi:hypothetical protein
MIQLKTTIKWSLTMSAAVLLTACVPHLTQQQCKTINWYDMGFNDSSQGQWQRNLGRDITDCAKFEIDVNTKAYARGFEAGAREFCRPANGFRLGVNGQNYNPICPPDRAQPFNQEWRRGLRKYCVPETGYNLGRSGKDFPNFCSLNQVVSFRNAYEAGRRIFDAIRLIQGEMDNNNRRMMEAARQIRTLNRNIRDWEQQLSQAKGPQRKELNQKINEGQREITELNRQINSMENNRDRLQNQLNKQNLR